jgi:hypothetical protein
MVKFIDATEDLLFLLTHCCVFCLSGLLGCFRMATLVDELQTVKLRNVGLERQLNAIYNKEEEERIRKEEAAKEDG